MSPRDFTPSLSLSRGSSEGVHFSGGGWQVEIPLLVSHGFVLILNASSPRGEEMLEMALRSWGIQLRSSNQLLQANLGLPGNLLSQLSVLAGRGGDNRGCISQELKDIKWFKKSNSPANPDPQLSMPKVRAEGRSVTLYSIGLEKSRFCPAKAAFPSRPAGITSVRAKIYKLSVSSSPPHQTTEQKNPLEIFFFLLFLAKDKARHFNCSNKNTSERPGVKG